MNTSRGLTQPRKRTTPRLGSPSIYSPDVLGYETITQDYWETDAIPSIRIVEPSDTEERTIRFPPASPSNSSTSAGSMDTADVPYMGRSISYQHPNPRSIIPHAPSISSLPFLSSSTRRSLSSPPLPRLPHEDFYSDDGTTGTGSTHSAGSSTASLHSSRSSSSSRRSPRPRSEKVLPPPPASSAPMSRYLSNGSSGMSKQTIESLKYTTKFPDRWISTSNEGEDARLLWDDNSDEVRGGRRTWTGHKTFLLGSVATVFAYGMAGIIGVILTYFRTWNNADVVLITDSKILLYITLASILCLLTSLIGLVGTILNSRPILAAYNLFLWPSGVAILVVGYLSYKRSSLSLDLKLNEAWSQVYDDLGRMRIQDSLHCCGYYSPFHEATFSKRCYPRTSLPGCKGKLYRFEREMLRRCYVAAFSIAPAHILNIFVALICANHVNRTFGKGLMPRPYRLNLTDVRENALTVLRSLPAPPNLRRHAISSPLSSVSMLSLQEPGSGLMGLGMSDDGTEDEKHWEPGTQDRRRM